MNKITFALESYKNIQELIKFSDQKAGAILVVNGLIITGYLDVIKNLTFMSCEEASTIEISMFLISLFTGLSLIVGTFFSVFKVIKPRLAEKYKEGDISLYYFEHLYNMGKEAIYKSYKEVDEEIMLKCLIDQQYEISSILFKKTKYLSYSTNCLLISVILFVFLVLISNLL